MSDAEWAFFEPFLIERGPKRGRPPGDHRRVLDGVFWIARTGAPWRDLPEFFGKWGSVYRQFRRWSVSGVWDVLLEALNESGAGQASVQMSTRRSFGRISMQPAQKGGSGPGFWPLARWLLDQNPFEMQWFGPAGRHHPDRRRGL
jgi:transposase